MSRKAVARVTSRTYRSAPLARAHGEREAERLLRKGLAAFRLTTGELERVKGSDLRKVALARLLLERTTARQSWIAERLAMCSAANVSQQVRRHRAAGSRLPGELRQQLATVSRIVD